MCVRGTLVELVISKTCFKQIQIVTHLSQKVYFGFAQPLIGEWKIAQANKSLVAKICMYEEAPTMINNAAP